MEKEIGEGGSLGEGKKLQSESQSSSRKRKTSSLNVRASARTRVFPDAKIGERALEKKQTRSLLAYYLAGGTLQK